MSKILKKNFFQLYEIYLKLENFFFNLIYF
jgi:hypothetical protein